MTLWTAASKSAYRIEPRFSLKAAIPASLHTARQSLPDAPSIIFATASKSTPRCTFIRREWIFKISTRAYNDGAGNSIRLSIRPGRSKASSNISTRFVAMISLIWVVGSNPSSYESNSIIVRYTSYYAPWALSERFPPIESASSINIMLGWCYLAL